MRSVLATLLAAGAGTAVAGVIFIYSGAYNVAASNAHWPLVYWALEKARVRSIQTHAAGIVPPKGFDEQPKVVGAVRHFAEHCAICHGAPGSPRPDLAESMYPQPPDLTRAATRYTPGELFWILKNGIKMSGMPSMANDGDDMLWSTVALLQRLPSMSDQEYNDLWMAAQAQSGHAGMNMGGTTAAPAGGTAPAGGRPEGK